MMPTTRVANLAEEWWPYYASRPWLSAFCLDRFRLPRRADPLLLAQRQLAICIVDTCGSQGQLLLLQGMVGKGTDAASFSHWNWRQRGEEISVWVHSNLESVELCATGRASLQKVEPLHHLEWKVKYVPGYIEARAQKVPKLCSSQSKKLPVPGRSAHGRSRGARRRWRRSGDGTRGNRR